MIKGDKKERAKKKAKKQKLEASFKALCSEDVTEAEKREDEAREEICVSITGERPEGHGAEVNKAADVYVAKKRPRGCSTTLLDGDGPEPGYFGSVEGSLLSTAS